MPRHAAPVETGTETVYNKNMNSRDLAQKTKNARIKKIETIGDYDVWLVDGEYVRKEINENFVEYDDHYGHRFIPRNELWIDEETNPDERRFFINHMFVEIGLLQNGESYDDAAREADREEEQRRTIELKEQNLLPLKKRPRELLNRIRTKMLPQYSGSVSVWLVRGRLVRDFFLVEYAEGGHDKVYTFIPKNEIWIDEVLSAKEVGFIVLHELHERRLMAGGKTYRAAHKIATLVEDYYRDHPKELDDRIQKEIASP